ncbi:MAG TPA: hypothetical protein VN081_03205 [Dongiaceae bacterium]|nr:hypothetical protein [Dongiaceae bacterium]
MEQLTKMSGTALYDIIGRMPSLNDVIAMIKDGGIHKNYKILVQPDFDNATKHDNDLLYDIVDTVEGKKINTRPLSLHQADFQMELIIAAQLQASEMVAQLSGESVSPVMSGESISPVMLPTDDLTEEEKDVINSFKDVPSKGRCFIVYVSTGCTCCAHENFYEGPFLTKSAAEGNAKYHRDRKTLASQYAAHGRQTVEEVNYEIVGHYIILDSWYAIPDGFRENGIRYSQMDNYR